VLGETDKRGRDHIKTTNKKLSTPSTTLLDHEIMRWKWSPYIIWTIKWL